MRRFQSQGDFRAIFKGQITITSSTSQGGVNFAKLKLPPRQIACVEKIIVKSQVPGFLKSENADFNAIINLIVSNREKLKTYLVDSGETKYIDGILVDFNSSQSYQSLRGDALIQEFDSETYLSDEVLLKVSATSTNLNMADRADATVKFEIQLVGYKFILTDEAREKILKVDV